MNRQEMITEVAAKTGDTAEVVTSFVDTATEAVLNHLFPFHDVEEVPSRYHRRVVEIAVYLVNKRGAEGQDRHNENGIDRTYESAEIPESMFEGLTPRAFVPSEARHENA